MLIMLAAIGTATAPTAQAVIDDACTIAGPYPDALEDSTDLDLLDGDLDGVELDGIMLVGVDYLFAIAYEDPSDLALFGTVSIDDESGDADIIAMAIDPGVAATEGLVSAGGSGDDIDDLEIGLVTTGTPGVGTWTEPFLEDLESEFDAPDFTNASCDGDGVADGWAFIVVECEDTGDFEISAEALIDGGAAVTEDFLCMAEPASGTITAVPTPVESNPALGNVSHSLIVATFVDAGGQPAHPNYGVDWSTNKCIVEARDESEYEGAFGDAALFAAYASNNPATAAAINDHASGASHSPPDTSNITFINDANPGPGITVRSIATAILHCENATPGVATVTAQLDKPGADITLTVDVTVIGPPQFITVVATPERLVCGEKATVLVTVTDAINQKVSDHTVVELITNYGGVIGGTGATLGLPGTGPVNPLSSSAAETFQGVATAYLLTSSNHVGAYEVVAAAGGSALGGYVVDYNWGTDDENDEDGDESFGSFSGQNGVFSTAVVTAQDTVTCTAGTPAVTAPNTGTGTISPPNTGDAGLAAPTSRDTASLFVIAGAVAFVLAGLASFGYARRS